MSDEKFGSAEQGQNSVGFTEELIRERAYQLYERRGRADGHDLEDWLEAEILTLYAAPVLLDSFLDAVPAHWIAQFGIAPDPIGFNRRCATHHSTMRNASLY